MATIKSYTDIEQSKVLATILPIESADMFLAMNGILPVMSKYIDNGLVTADETAIPCWSLASLLSVIPKRIKDYNVLRIDINEKDTSIWYDDIGCGVNNELPDITKETPIDACYEMILKLKELNLL